MVLFCIPMMISDEHISCAVLLSSLVVCVCVLVFYLIWYATGALGIYI